MQIYWAESKDICGYFHACCFALIKFISRDFNATKKYNIIQQTPNDLQLFKKNYTEKKMIHVKCSSSISNCIPK